MEIIFSSTTDPLRRPAACQICQFKSSTMICLSRFFTQVQSYFAVWKAKDYEWGSICKRSRAIIDGGRVWNLASGIKVRVFLLFPPVETTATQLFHDVRWPQVYVLFTVDCHLSRRGLVISNRSQLSPGVSCILDPPQRCPWRGVQNVEWVDGWPANQLLAVFSLSLNLDLSLCLDDFYFGSPWKPTKSRKERLLLLSGLLDIPSCLCFPPHRTVAAKHHF